MAFFVARVYVTVVDLVQNNFLCPRDQRFIVVAFYPVPLYANCLIECLFFTYDCQKMLMIFFWCY